MAAVLVETCAVGPEAGDPVTKKPPKPPRGGRAHNLKCWAEPFWAIWQGRKVHEFRKDDRGFQEGDVLQLHLWDPESKLYTGDWCTRRITYISRGPAWGIPEGYVCMSIAPEPR